MAASLADGSDAPVLARPSQAIGHPRYRGYRGRRQPVAKERSATRIHLRRAGDFTRPLVPRPHRDPHPRVRGESQVVFLNGNYQGYEADKKKRLGEEGAQPKRIRHKRLRT